ncbi:MAG: methyltransferase, partial [Alphaproteobacteria bacterium]
VAHRGNARDPRIRAAFARVPREPFAGPGPWSVVGGGSAANGSGYIQTPSDDPAFLYQDTLIALDAGRGINIGEPSLHARCLDALTLQPGERVLHVGAGAGYYTTLLADLVGPTGHVEAYEIDAALASRAERNLADLPHVTLRAQSGVADNLPSVDAIYVNAGITQPERGWLDALRPGGRLLFPLQPERDYGGMLLVSRSGGANPVWPARFVSRAGFIGCHGPQVENTGTALRAAFATRRLEEVKSLRLTPDVDRSCWVAGDGWWLSTEPAGECVDHA